MKPPAGLALLIHGKATKKDDGGEESHDDEPGSQQMDLRLLLKALDIVPGPKADMSKAVNHFNALTDNSPTEEEEEKPSEEGSEEYPPEETE